VHAFVLYAAHLGYRWYHEHRGCNVFSVATFALRFATFTLQVGTGVCKKKAKILIERLSFRSPPPPPSSKLAGAAGKSFTRFGFFSAARRTHVDCGVNFELGGQGGRTAT
jgi:hypothetical protein